jgi:hypothetical protein
VRERGGEKFEAQARFLDDPAERDRALAAAGRKYWMKKSTVSSRFEIGTKSRDATACG